MPIVQGQGGLKTYSEADELYTVHVIITPACLKNRYSVYTLYKLEDSQNEAHLALSCRLQNFSDEGDNIQQLLLSLMKSLNYKRLYLQLDHENRSVRQTMLLIVSKQVQRSHLPVLSQRDQSKPVAKVLE